MTIPRPYRPNQLADSLFLITLGAKFADKFEAHRR